MLADVKLVVLGNSGVGKTSMIVRFVTDNFKADTGSTVGASYMTKIVSMGSSYMKFNIWDTAGQERFRSIVHMYYKDVEVAILVYDLTDPESFAQLQWWYQEMQQHNQLNFITAIVANKADLEAHEKVPVEEAQEFADSIGGVYFRTSAKSNSGISEMFMQLAYQVVEHRKNTHQQRASKPVLLRSELSRERVEQQEKKGGCC